MLFNEANMLNFNILLPSTVMWRLTTTCYDFVGKWFPQRVLFGSCVCSRTSLLAILASKHVSVALSGAAHQTFHSQLMCLCSVDEDGHCKKRLFVLQQDVVHEQLWQRRCNFMTWCCLGLIPWTTRIATEPICKEAKIYEPIFRMTDKQVHKCWPVFVYEPFKKRHHSCLETLIAACRFMNPF